VGLAPLGRKLVGQYQYGHACERVSLKRLPCGHLRLNLKVVGMADNDVDEDLCVAIFADMALRMWAWAERTVLKAARVALLDNKALFEHKRSSVADAGRYSQFPFMFLLVDIVTSELPGSPHSSWHAVLPFWGGQRRQSLSAMCQHNRKTHWLAEDAQGAANLTLPHWPQQVAEHPQERVC
jgi:hypothetical protein